MKTLTEIKEIYKSKPLVEKNCKRCKDDKPLYDFYRDRNSKDGRYYICIDCVKMGKVPPMTPDYKIKEHIVYLPEIIMPEYNQDFKEVEVKEIKGRIERHNGKQWLVLPSRV